MRAFDINELNWKEFTRLRSDLVLKLKTRQKKKNVFVHLRVCQTGKALLTFCDKQKQVPAVTSKTKIF